MTKYKQGTQGTVMLILSGIGNILTACANLVQLAFFGLASYRVFTAVSEEHFDMLYLSKYPIRELGFKTVLIVQSVILLIAVLISLIMAFSAFIHAKDDKRSAAFTVTGAVFSLLTLVLMIYSRNILQIFQLIIWLLLMFGGIKSAKPRDLRMKQAYYQQDSSYFDPGIRRPKPFNPYPPKPPYSAFGGGPPYAGNGQTRGGGYGFPDQGGMPNSGAYGQTENQTGPAPYNGQYGAENGYQENGAQSPAGQGQADRPQAETRTQDGQELSGSAGDSSDQDSWY